MNELNLGSFLRRKILYFIIMGFFSLLCFQLFKMQILEHAAFNEKSNENSIKKINKDAPRGIFLDRNFNTIVSNKASFTLQITPAEYDKTLNRKLENILGVDSGYIDGVLESNKMYSKYHPVKIFRNAEFKIIAWVEENADMLPGVNYKVDLQRDYSFGINGSHMFGYIREISADLLDKKKDEYLMGDFIGHTGIEKIYEKYLRGKKGSDFFIVDARQRTIGNYLEGINNIDPVKGYDLVLSIDAETQIIAEKALVGKKGAVVAIEPTTGEILAFASSPNYDLAAFASVTSSEVWENLSKDESKPLFNRAAMSINPPGSTIKMLAALIGLKEGLITSHTTINCKGVFQYGKRPFKCTHIHGSVDVVESIEKSCNIFYYQLILKIGLDRWANYLRQFGFGKATGLDIGQESDGIIPSTKYYNKRYGKNKWTEGNLVSLGIGQGELSVTPVQLAQYTCLLANNGKTKRPHFIKGYLNTYTQEFIPLPADDITVDMPQQYLDLVKKGMYKVVQGEGSANHIKLKDIEIAGKTGTAQNPGEDHALFIAFAPFENPKIAVAVLVENAGFGSTHAAPIARDVIKAYLTDNNEKNSKDLIASTKKAAGN